MYLWLDDLRDPTFFSPDYDWTWVKTVEEAQELLKTGNVEAASLDNDLGQGLTEGRALVYWMAENDIWPSRWCVPHTANPVAEDYMRKMIERYGPYS